MLTIKEIAKVVIYLNKTINIKTTKTIAIIITEDEITKKMKVKPAMQFLSEI